MNPTIFVPKNDAAALAKERFEAKYAKNRKIVGAGKGLSLAANRTGVADIMQAATVLANGAILVDEYDRMIFDRVLRTYPMWNWISKEVSPGDFTNGFNQSAVATARSADKRNLSYSGTNPTRSARTPQEMKAIVNDLTLGMYDRSVYQVQGRRFGDLTEKDVRDSKNSCFRQWQTLIYTGSTSVSALEFDGLNKFLGTGAATVTAATSVVKAIQERVVTMMNVSTYEVLPTDLFVNARVRQIIAAELRKDGADRIPQMELQGEKIEYLDTAAGPLPIRVDPFNRPVVATPTVYRTFILTKDTVNWYYVPPLGNEGAEPKTFDIAQTNALDSQFKTVMFGALDILGIAVTDHNFQLNVEDRTTVVSPSGNIYS